MGALMAPLSNIKLLSAEDMCTLLDLYMGADATQKVPTSKSDTRDDEAAGSSAMSIALA